MSTNKDDEHRGSQSLDDVEFTDLERRLIESLVIAPEKRLSRTELLKAVWDIEFDPGTNMLDVLVFRVRKKLVGTPYLLNTEHRFGYQLGLVKSDS